MTTLTMMMMTTTTLVMAMTTTMTLTIIMMMMAITMMMMMTIMIMLKMMAMTIMMVMMMMAMALVIMTIIIIWRLLQHRKESRKTIKTRKRRLEIYYRPSAETAVRFCYSIRSHGRKSCLKGKTLKWLHQWTDSAWSFINK